MKGKGCNYGFFYKLEGKEVRRCETEADCREAFENRFIKRTELSSGCIVSTAFLVMDHRFDVGGEPLLFETMVFPECEICHRYSTYDEAIAGHDRVVDQLMTGGGGRNDK